MSVPASSGEVRCLRDGAVWRVELHNPKRRNAMTWSMYERLRQICLETREATQLRALVIRGAQGAFAAGTDIEQFADFNDAADGVAYERRMSAVVDAMLGVRVPILGVVEGPAVGGGLAIAACCDVLVASEDARFGVPIARTLGNIIAPAVARRLRERIGPSRTMAMLLTSRLLSADDAASAGFVHAVVPAADLDATAEDVIVRIAAGAPLTLAAIKEIDRRLGGGHIDDAEDILARCYGSADFREGVAAFLEGRAPQWRGT